MTSLVRCPCGSGDTYIACCGRLHSGEATAATAVALMRSRFCAFAVGDRDYLLETWHPSTRPTELVLDQNLRWTHLDIVDTVRGGLFDQVGTVEFRAHYRQTGTRASVHERSSFTRLDGRWRYLGADPK
ncbi:YchJ family protein [Jatrophihabitans sp. DSM 45814]